jgi:hypothetical protein
MSEHPNTFTAFVDPRYNASERQQIGTEIINYIVRRTKAGEGINKNPFKSKYSNNYVKTAEFHIAGKVKDKVNLTLSGDMLDSLVVLETSTGRIKIGFDTSFENDKSVWVERKGFRFLGLSDKELNDIVNRFGPPNSPLQPANISESFTQNFIRTLRGS